MMENALITVGLAVYVSIIGKCVNHCMLKCSFCIKSSEFTVVTAIENANVFFDEMRHSIFLVIK